MMHKNTVAQQLTQRCLNLLQIPSVTGDEQRIADYLEQWAHQESVYPKEHIIRIGNSLSLGQLDPTRPNIALVGHTDTVPPHADTPTPQIRDTRVYGRGASDMKGALAVMQVLAESLPLAELPMNLLLLFYDKEEGPYLQNGLEPVLNELQWFKEIDLAIAMEPTSNTIELGCMGSLQATVTFRGRTAHSARPWQGDNAIHKAATLLGRLQQPCQVHEIEGLQFRDTINATMAHGGQTRNVIPDQFELNVNMRFAPLEPIATTIANAKAFLHEICQGADIDIYDIAPPGPVPKSNPYIQHLRDHGALTMQPKQAWTDVARLAKHGIDAVNFGPGNGSEAHQVDEWIDIAAMVDSLKILLRTLKTPLVDNL